VITTDVNAGTAEVRKNVVSIVAVTLMNKVNAVGKHGRGYTIQTRRT